MAPSEKSSYGSLLFAAVVATVLGLLVSATANLLAPRITTNREVERKKHVLITTRFLEPDASPARAHIEQLYDRYIVEQELAIDGTTLPLFLAVDSKGRARAICIPLAGMGLWGPIKGYLALDGGARSVLRITFYEHRETPGLGAEIADTRWTSKWSGKSIVDSSDRLTPITVKKGKIDPVDDWENSHAVDGISGATISGNAVARTVAGALQTYRFYLEEQWQK